MKIEYMLSKKRQRKYLKKVKKEAATRLRKLAASHSPEDLHEFRVAVKKIKSFGAFLNPSRGKKFVKPLNRAFQEAGIVRNISNAMKVEDDHVKISMETRCLRKAEYEAAHEKFIAGKKTYLRSLNKTKKKLAGKISSIPARIVKHYLRSELSDVPGILAQKDDEAIHSCRKRLKNILYLYESLPFPLKKKFKLEVGYIDKLQDTIGRWHDLLLALPLLENRVDPAELLIIHHEKENLLQEALSMGENFFTKAKI